MPIKRLNSGIAAVQPFRTIARFVLTLRQEVFARKSMSVPALRPNCLVGPAMVALVCTADMGLKQPAAGFPVQCSCGSISRTI
ncbi:hypothetical protein MPLA_2130095 [Mesorhizobium sp. ORS 3359]|nr:hypothetical protein MPLA_2130095 [Mesorhizobium sp. ORS 3359]